MDKADLCMPLGKSLLCLSFPWKFWQGCWSYNNLIVRCSSGYDMGLLEPVLLDFTQSLPPTEKHKKFSLKKKLQFWKLKLSHHIQLNFFPGCSKLLLHLFRSIFFSFFSFNDFHDFLIWFVQWHQLYWPNSCFRGDKLQCYKHPWMNQVKETGQLKMKKVYLQKISQKCWVKVCRKMAWESKNYCNVVESSIQPETSVWLLWPWSTKEFICPQLVTPNSWRTLQIGS